MSWLKPRPTKISQQRQRLPGSMTLNRPLQSQIQSRDLQRFSSSDADAENPEVVNISEHGGLAVQIEGHHSVGLASGFGGAGAAGGEHMGDVGKRGLELAVSRIEPGGEIGLMHLGAAREHGGDKGNADAAADIAREVDEAGGGVIFAGRDEGVSGSVDGHEKKGEAHGLEYARGGQGAEIDGGVEVRHVDQGKGNHNQAK